MLLAPMLMIVRPTVVALLYMIIINPLNQIHEAWSIENEPSKMLMFHYCRFYFIELEVLFARWLFL